MTETPKQKSEARISSAKIRNKVSEKSGLDRTRPDPDDEEDDELNVSYFDSQTSDDDGNAYNGDDVNANDDGASRSVVQKEVENAPGNVTTSAWIQRIGNPVKRPGITFIQSRVLFGIF